MLVEEGECRGLCAVGTLAVVDGVDVHAEDLVFGVLLLQLESKDCFTGLAAVRRLEALGIVGKDRVADVLHRERGGALGASGGQVRHGRAHDAGDVHPVVLVEALILNSDDRVQQVGRDLVEWHHLAVLEVQVGQEHAIRRVDLRGLCNREGRRVVDVGQSFEPVARYAQADRNTGARQDERAHKHERDRTRDHLECCMRMLLTPEPAASGHTTPLA